MPFFLEMFGLSANNMMFSVKADDFDYETEMAAGDLDHRVRIQRFTIRSKRI